MKAWLDVIVPHADIRKGGFDEAVFAADLSDVVAQRGPLEYCDATTFFRKTYPTAGLQRLMLAVLGRLTGTYPGEGVIQIQTPFGGGKTHSLIALYHALRSPQDTSRLLADVQPELRCALDSLTQMSPAPKVVTFVGTAADALSGTTPWGDMARALGRPDLLQEHDRTWTAPGKDRLHELLGQTRALILMDELAEYLVRLTETQMAQMLAFLHELTETVKVQQNCALVVALPSSAPYGEAGERALNQLQRIFGRVESIYTPVEGEEVYEVIRRRLFETTPDRAEVVRTAEAFWQMYQQLGEDVPASAREPAYRERLVRAYPFHPELIDILYERWSTFSTFQRTRGVLRLLAEVVADLYQQRHSAPLILPAHLNLANRRIRQELLKHIGNQYDPVVSSDISGDGAIARRIDQSLGSELARLRLAESLATTIFFASFSGGERQGVGSQRLRLAVLTPDVQPALVGDTLQRLESELWYLHTENSIFRFLTDPNLNRIITEREEGVQRQQVTDAIRQYLRQFAGSRLQVIVCPTQSQDVTDAPPLRLAVLSPDQPRDAQDTENLVRSLLEMCGSAFRTYRNTVLVLAADASAVEQLRSRVRRLLALKNIQQDQQLVQRLSSENRQLLESRLRDAEQNLQHDLLNVYRHLARRGESGVQWLDMGLPTAARRESLSERVHRFLQEESLLATRLAPKFLLDRVLRPDEEEKAVSEVVEVFLRYTAYPIVDNRDVVHQAVQEGVRLGHFAIRLGDRVICREEVPLSDLADAVLVRQVPEVQPPAPAEAPAVTGTTVTTSPAASGLREPVAAPAVARRYHLRLRVPSDRFSDIFRGVVTPLHKHDPNLQVEMVIEATLAAEGSDAALSTIRETLSQAGIQPEEERWD